MPSDKFNIKKKKQGENKDKSRNTLKNFSTTPMLKSPKITTEFSHLANREQFKNAVKLMDEFYNYPGTKLINEKQKL